MQNLKGKENLGTAGAQGLFPAASPRLPEYSDGSCIRATNPTTDPTFQLALCTAVIVGGRT